MRRREVIESDIDYCQARVAALQEELAALPGDGLYIENKFGDAAFQFDIYDRRRALFTIKQYHAGRAVGQGARIITVAEAVRLRDWLLAHYPVTVVA